MPSNRLILAALSLSLLSCAGPMGALRDSSTPRSSSGGEYLGEAYYQYLRAMDAENIGDMDAALEHFRQALVFDPGSYQIMVHISQVQERLGQRDDALAYAQRALALNPSYLPGILQIARIYAYSGRFEEARAAYQQALTLDGEQEQIYLELARLYRRDGALTEALRVLETYTLRSPRASVAHLSLKAAILRDMDRGKDAEEVYLQLLSTYPWVEQPRRELIGLFLTDGGAEYAADRLEKLYEQEPWQDWIPSALVDLYIQLENIPALEAQLTELSLRNPEDRDLRLAAVQALIRNGAWDAADAILKPALAWEGGDGDDARYLYASIAFSQERYEEAAERFKAIPETSASYDDALIRRAFALEQLGRLDEGVAEVERFLVDHPDASDVRFALGAIYQDADRPQDAIAAFDALMVREPDHVDAIAQRAVALYDLGERDAAISALTTQIARLPGHIRLHEVLASLYAREHRYADGVEVLQDALRLNADDYELRYQLATLLDQAGQKQEAVAQMKLLLERYPDNPDVLNFIGYTWAELGVELTEAEMMIRKALEQEPDNGYVIDSLGWVFFKQAEYAKAIETLEQAVRLTDREPVIVEHLADAYLKNGRAPEALTLYTYALGRLREDPDANPDDITRLGDKLSRLAAQGVQPKPAAILAGD